MDDLQRRIEELLEKLRHECHADTYNEMHCLLQAMVARIAFLNNLGKDLYIHYGIYDDRDDND